MPFIIIALSRIDFGFEPVFAGDEFFLALIFFAVPPVLMLAYIPYLKRFPANCTAWQRIYGGWYYGAFSISALIYLFVLVAAAIFSIQGHLDSDNVYGITLAALAAVNGAAGVWKVFHKEAKGIAFAIAAFGVAFLSGINIGFGSALGTTEYYQTLAIFGIALLLMASLFPYIRKPNLISHPA